MAGDSTAPSMSSWPRNGPVHRAVMVLPTTISWIRIVSADALTFVEAIEAPSEEYFAKYKARDEQARDRYREIASKPLAENEIYVIDIIRNNWKNGQSI